MPFHRACHRQIDTSVILFVVAGPGGKRVGEFGSPSIWLQVGRKDDMLGQDHRAIAKKRHGANRVTELAKVSGPLVVKLLFHRFGMNGGDVFALS